MQLTVFNAKRSFRKGKKAQGFTLLEITIALVILVILTIQIADLSKISRDYDLNRTSAAQVGDVKSLLLSFLQTNGYLPCPDTDNNGWENRTGSQCDAAKGKLPHLMLGITQNDASFQPYYYQVNARTTSAEIDDPINSASFFGTSTIPNFNLSTPPSGINAGNGNMVICDAAESQNCNISTGSDHFIEEAAIAVVVAFGNNSVSTWQQINSNSIHMDAPAEQENADGDAYFWLAKHNFADDNLTWINGYEAKYTLLQSSFQLN
jgi:prepilin-type N-terminal cleavage/methylation domain-containing protein